MKKSKTKKEKKYILIPMFFFALGILISISFSYVIAETLIKSEDVYYDKTNSGLAVNNVQAAIDGTCTKFSNQLQDFLLKVYPVGSIYISYNSTNPGTLFGGAWENYGSGRVLRGINSGTAGSTGGSDTVTLKEANLPSHTHDISHTHTTISTTTSTMNLTANSEGSSHSHTFNFSMGSSWQSGDRIWLKGPEAGDWAIINGGGEHTHTVTGTVTIPELTTKTSTLTSGSTGSGSSFSVQNQYITVYMWRRTK